MTSTVSQTHFFNISQPCIGDLCYEEVEAIKAYLDLRQTRQLLGVEIPSNFSACDDLGGDFDAQMDKWIGHTQDYVANLLDRGIRILIYAGTYDWRCNWVANKLWVDKLEWSGQDQYVSEKWREWSIDGSSSKAGEVKETPLLTFATIRGAGHMMSRCSICVTGGRRLINCFVISTHRTISPQKRSQWYRDGWPAGQFDY